jgi:hypothetical protein
MKKFLSLSVAILMLSSAFATDGDQKVVVEDKKVMPQEKIETKAESKKDIESSLGGVEKLLEPIFKTQSLEELDDLYENFLGELPPFLPMYQKWIEQVDFDMNDLEVEQKPSEALKAFYEKGGNLKILLNSLKKVSLLRKDIEIQLTQIVEIKKKLINKAFIKGESSQVLKSALEEGLKNLENMLKEFNKLNKPIDKALWVEYLSTKKIGPKLLPITHPINLKDGENIDKFVIGKRVSNLFPNLTPQTFMFFSDFRDIQSGAPTMPMTVIRLGNRLFEVYPGRIIHDHNFRPDLFHMMWGVRSEKPKGFKDTELSVNNPVTDKLLSHQTRHLRRDYDPMQPWMRDQRFADHFFARSTQKTPGVFEYMGRFTEMPDTPPMMGMGMGAMPDYEMRNSSFTLYFVAIEEDEAPKKKNWTRALHQPEESGYEDLKVTDEFKQRFAKTRATLGRGIHSHTAFPKPSHLHRFGHRERIHVRGEPTFAPLIGKSDVEGLLTDSPDQEGLTHVKGVGKNEKIKY